MTTSEGSLFSSSDRSPQIFKFFKQLLEKLARDRQAVLQLFILMVNYGNYLEIMCEYQRQKEMNLGGPAYEVWQRLAEGILWIEQNETFRYSRIQIQNKEAGGDAESVQSSVNNVKGGLIDYIRLQGISINMISFDAIQYKIPLSASEIFCQVQPAYVQQLNETSVGIIDALQIDLLKLLRDKMYEYRRWRRLTENPLIPDVSIFLESLSAAQEDQQRETRIKMIGDNNLIEYLGQMRPLFMAGFVPATLTPAKIFACQDIVSATELRGNIIQLSSDQILQSNETLNNPNVRHGMKVLADQESGADRLKSWSKEQVQTLSQGAMVTSSLAEGLRSFGDQPFKPQTDMGQQISGGSNSLMQQINFNQQGSIVNLDPLQKAQLKEDLSLLLACIRIRFNATQNSNAELVSGEDIDHLEIVRRLSTYCDPDTQRSLYEQASVLEVAIIDGHNKVKFNDNDLEADAFVQTKSLLESTARNSLMNIPFLQENNEDGNNASQKLMDCIYLAMAQQQRMNIEQGLRKNRRMALFAGVAKYSGSDTNINIDNVNA